MTPEEVWREALRSALHHGGANYENASAVSVIRAAIEAYAAEKVAEALAWRSLTEQAPCGVGDQAQVLFCGPTWGWPILGVVSNFGTLDDWVAKTGSAEHWPGQYQFMMYLQDQDRYEIWDSEQPTHWLLAPSAMQAANQHHGGNDADT